MSPRKTMKPPPKHRKPVSKRTPSAKRIVHSKAKKPAAEDHALLRCARHAVDAHNWVRHHPRLHHFFHQSEWLIHCVYFGAVATESIGKVYAAAGGILLVLSILVKFTGGEET